MANPRIICFLEDLQQEQMVTALVRRICEDAGIPARAALIETRNGRGGVPAAVHEFEKFARKLGALDERKPDIVILALDTDCHPEVKRDLVSGIVEALNGFTCVVLCLPDPYVERWYLLDLGAVRAVLGRGPDGAYPSRCDKAYYKTELERVVRDAGFDALLGGYEFADQIVPAMDLHRVGREDPFFGRFVDDLSACIRQFQLSVANS